MFYNFINKITGETKEIEMPMADYEPYKGEEGNDDNWERVYDVPQVNIGNYVAKKVDPWDNKQFIDRTGNMKGTYGDMQDYSSQLSEKRAKESITGEDPIKRKHFDKYKKATGKKHMSDHPKVIETKNIKVEL
jgi:hypothetical protein|tara:strand:+ start:805 stop:1203 length:399 start_codon:yes stop_codon:yes gene_type:complete